MHFDIYIDGHPETHWMGHALAETGCIWLAAGREEVAVAAPRAIANFYSWLRAHGEPGAVEVSVAEISVDVIDTQVIPDLGISGAAVGFFTPDREPAGDAEIAAAVRRLGYARRDLLEVVSGLPSKALNWKPPGSERTLTENLLHLRNCQFFYLSRLLPEKELEALLPPPWPEALYESLHWAQAGSVKILLDLPDRYRGRVFPAREPTEEWTARKVLRRFVEHELEHLAVVRRVVSAWRSASAG